MKRSKTSVYTIAVTAVLMTALIFAASGCANTASDGGNAVSNEAQGEGAATPDVDDDKGAVNSNDAGKGEGEGKGQASDEEPGRANPEPGTNTGGGQPGAGSASGGKEEPKADDGTSGQTYVAENEAFRILSPEQGAEVGRTFKVKGQARVFEAAFSYTLEDGHEVLAEGHVQASQGAPEWGDFEFEVQMKEPISPTSPTGTLILYEESAKDGSPIHQLIVTVEFDPALLPATE
ncbi:Gmad2 immunoglobulin-like domain-containing protein [Paenibacillus aurantiacus]|uniref:Gmad2 immunoglobulin-like domain-containing protein n=1 Tax=Paenibacillus aurantiacus TaxID=1936118 RepID=A0ABV5KVJ5_9BACL